MSNCSTELLSATILASSKYNQQMLSLSLRYRLPSLASYQWHSQPFLKHISMSYNECPLSVQLSFVLYTEKSSVKLNSCAVTAWSERALPRASIPLKQTYQLLFEHTQSRKLLWKTQRCLRQEKRQQNDSLRCSASLRYMPLSIRASVQLSSV